jgi:GT2 family glycosyltransferase
MLMAGAAYRLGHGDEDRGQFDRPMQVLAGCGAAVLYRREAFIAAGQLDPEFFAYLDDLDLALRTQLMGYRGLYVPNAVAYHVGSATLGEAMHPRIVEYITRNQIYLLTKNYPRPVLVRLLPRIVFYQGLWMLLAFRNGAPSAYFRGLVSGIRNRKRMRRSGLALIGRIGHDEFLARLCDSERQVYNWHQSRSPKQQSALLKMYFRLFGRP